MPKVSRSRRDSALTKNLKSSPASKLLNPAVEPDALADQPSASTPNQRSAERSTMLSAPQPPWSEELRASAPNLSREHGWSEVSALLAAMLAIVTIQSARVGGPQFLNDSYQYVSIAENVLRRGALATSIVHFDEERARGRIPAPQTTFAPGYSLLISSLAWSRLPLEWLGLVISVASSLGVLMLLRTAASSMGLHGDSMRLCLMLWAFNAQASLYAITMHAEAVFTVCWLGAVTLLLWEVRAESTRWRVPLACALVGFACWVRYAGLFFVLAFHLFALYRLFYERRDLKMWLGSLLTCDAIVAVLLARNIFVSGVWTGGNSRTVAKPLANVLHRLGVSAYELLLGSLQSPRTLPFGLFAILVTAGVVGAVGLSVAGSRSPAATSFAETQRVLLLLCALAYLPAITYAGATTQVSLNSRMFVPLLPVLALMAGLLASRMLRTTAPWPRAGRAFVGAFAIGFLGTNLLSMLSPPAKAPHRTVADAMSLPMADGRPLTSWIDRTIPRDAVLLAVDGQATGYLLRRSTISAVGRRFTALTWAEQEVRRTVADFRVSFIIVFPEVVATGGVDGFDSDLFRSLAAREPPSWLELVAQNARVLVYAIAKS
jgi:hypothetical protein